MPSELELAHEVEQFEYVPSDGSPEVVVTGTVGDQGMAQCQRSRCEDVGRRRRITLAGQDVEHDIGGMNAVRDRLGAGCFDGRQAVGPELRVEDVDHLTIAIVGTGEELAPYTFDRGRRHPSP